MNVTRMLGCCQALAGECVRIAEICLKETTGVSPEAYYRTCAGTNALASMEQTAGILVVQTTTTFTMCVTSMLVNCNRILCIKLYIEEFSIALW